MPYQGFRGVSLLSLLYWGMISIHTFPRKLMLAYLPTIWRYIDASHPIPSHPSTGHYIALRTYRYILCASRTQYFFQLTRSETSLGTALKPLVHVNRLNALERSSPSVQGVNVGAKMVTLANQSSSVVFWSTRVAARRNGPWISWILSHWETEYKPLYVASKWENWTPRF